MAVDYHIHSNLTNDVAKDMTISNIARTAKEKGLEGIAITNHLIFEEIYYDTKMPTIEPRQIDEYIEECKRAEEKTSISIKPSLEIDYSHEFESEIKDVLDSHNLEFILGAVHLLELDNKYYNIGIAESDIGMLTQTDYLKIVDEDELWKNYFEKQKDAVRSGLFDVLTHPDLPKKTSKLSYKFDDYRVHAEKLIDVILDSLYDTCIEINASGLRVQIREIIPNYSFLEILRTKASEKEVTPMVSVGSDAHCLESIGRDLNKATDLANTMGFDILS